MTDTEIPGDSNADTDDIRPISIIDEMKRSYIDYAMSVIVSRALPDARDGLKPVHRRILYSMYENNYDWNKPYRKSARIVGDVIGKYHPHGDTAIYDALVRMAQDFSMGLVLIDGQGNFGSVDGDPPAAMRYTEARLMKPAHSIIDDLDKDTVDFKENYDNSEQEPSVMPARFPNLLVNGSSGIAVGMATNIPPFNMGEVIDTCLALMDDPDLSDEQMLEMIPGPDFPTGGTILGNAGTRGMHLEGRGTVYIRGKATIETMANERERIVIHEIPYQVNKATMIEKIAEIVRDKRLEGISDIRDESDRDGMRVVIEIKRDATGQVVLNNLYKQTQLQSTFPGNLVALDRGKPQVMTIRQLLDAFLDFRVEVVVRRTKYLLNKARDRAHLLIGLALAVSNIEEVIKIIRGAKDAATAREELLAKTWDMKDVAGLLELVDDYRNPIIDDKYIKLSDEQARAILELRLSRLTQMGREEIDGEMKELAVKLLDFLDILTNRSRISDIIRSELIEVRDAFAVPRRTEIVPFDGDLDDEDLIMREEMVLTVSHGGYVKRVPLDTYRAQRRGGKGRSGMSTKDEDFVNHILVVNTHTPILFFTSEGMVYKQKVWRLPLGSPQNRGKALINFIPLSEGERITSILPMPEEGDEEALAKIDLMFATQSGTVRRNKLSDFTNVNRGGKIAMKLDDGDHIIGVLPCQENEDVLITSQKGQAIRFAVTDVRVFKGRGSVGVRGINLANGDKVISMTIINGLGEITSDTRTAYLKRAAFARRTVEEATQEAVETNTDETTVELTDEQFAQMGASEQFILTLSENGYAKRTSSFEYRRTSRGGKGITAMVVNERNGGLIDSFPVEEDDQIMLVTDGGQLIRTPIKDIRIAGRVTQGVTVFNTAKDEKVVSVQCVREKEDEEDVAEQDEGNQNSENGDDSSAQDSE